MKKKRKNKQKETKEKVNETKLRMYEYENPFKDIPMKDRVKIMKEVGKNARKTIDEEIINLNDLILKIEPLHLLSLLSKKFISDMSKSNYDDFQMKGKILPHHLEYLQAVILKNDREKYSNHEQYMKHFVNIEDSLVKIFTNFSLERFETIKDGELSKFFQLEMMRMHTVSIRGWAYPQHANEILYGIFDPLDIKVKEKENFKIRDFIDMLNILPEIIGEKLSELSKIANIILSQKTILDIFNNFIQYFPEIKWTIEDINKMISSLTSNSEKIEYFKFVVSSYIEMFYLPDTFIIKSEKMIELLKLNASNVSKVLDPISLKFGDLKDFDEGNFLLNNPIWKQIFIDLEGNYFCPLVFNTLSFSIEIIEKLIFDLKIFPNENRAYHKSRSDFLEKKIYELFQERFGKDNVFLGIKWKKANIEGIVEEFENDVIILFEKCLIIAEAKSHRIDGSVLRGSEESLKTTIYHTITYPTIQSKRFIEHLQTIQNFSEDDKFGNNLSIDINEIDLILRINISLDRLGDISANLKNLQELGYIPSDLKFVPTMSLPDLMIVLDIIESHYELIHYIIRRDEFEKNASFTAEEIDLLGFYVLNSFNIGDKEYDQNFHMRLYGTSYYFNDYFLQDKTKKVVDKPKRIFNSWWLSIIEELNKKRPKNWLQGTNILMNCSLDDQKLFTIKVKKLNKKIKKKGFKPETNQQNFIVMEFGPKKRREIIVAFAYQKISKEKRNEYIHNLMGDLFYEGNYLMGVVIGFDTDELHRDLPYHVFMLFRP